MSNTIHYVATRLIDQFNNLPGGPGCVIDSARVDGLDPTLFVSAEKLEEINKINAYLEALKTEAVDTVYETKQDEYDALQAVLEKFSSREYKENFGNPHAYRMVDIIDDACEELQEELEEELKRQRTMLLFSLNKDTKSLLSLLPKELVETKIAPIVPSTLTK